MRKCFLIPKVDFEVSWLKSHLQPGDRVLPLGLAPYTTLQNLLPNVDHLEAWVPFQESRRLAMRAYELNQAFAGEAMRGAVREGYDWPGICINNQDYFFRDILLAEALSLALTQSGMEEVVWVGKPSPVPIVALPTSKAVGRTTQFYLGNRFQVLTPPRSLFSTSCIPYGEKIVNAGRLLRKRILLSEKRKVRECRVVAVFPSTGEWQRFSQPLLELHREFGDGFQLWSLGLAPKSLNEWAASERIPVVWVPYPDREAEGDLRFFESHWKRWQAEGRSRLAREFDCPVLASDLLQFHFRFHFTRVWPRMAEYARVLERYLTRAKARFVVGSTNPAPSQLFPFHVASKLGIPSIALPHGYVQNGDSKIGSSLIACRNRFERLHFVRSFPEDRQVRLCSNAADDLSYSRQPFADSFPERQRVVAVLTADPEVPETLMAMADRKEFWAACSQLAQVPEDLADFHFIVKAHPRLSLSGFFQNLEIPCSRLSVLEPQTSLPHLLKRAWAVIMFNHFGSAAVHAIRAGKPIFFLNSAGLYWPFTEWLSFPAGEVVQDVAAVWSLLRQLKSSPGFYDELSGRCRKFAAEFLQPPDKTLAQQIFSLEGAPPSQKPPRLFPPRPVGRNFPPVA